MSLVKPGLLKLTVLAFAAGTLMVAAPASAGPHDHEPIVVAKAKTKKSKKKVSSRRPAAKKLSKKEIKARRLLVMAKYLYLQEKNYKEAAKTYAKVVRLDKDNVDAGLMVAQCKERLDDTKGAAKYLSRLAKKNPKSSKVWVALGKLQLKKLDQPDKAKKSYQKALEADSRNAEAYRALYDMVLAKAVKGDKTVLPELVKYLEGYLKTASFKKGLHYKTAERLWAKFKGGDLGLLVFDGKEAYKAAWTSRRMGAINRHMNTAREKFEQCVKMKPAHQECHYFLGMIYSSVKASQAYDVDKAKAEFKKAPQVPEAWVELGIVLRKEDDVPGAEAAFKKALALNSRHQRAHLQLGILLKLDGRDKDAIASLEKAYQVNRYSSMASKALSELASIEPEHKLVQLAFRFGKLKGTIFQTEKYKGAMAALEKRFGGVDPNAPEKKVLEEILHRLISHNDIPPEHTMSVQVLNAPIVNAFAAPNGNIYFTKGFFKMLQKELPKRPINADHDVIAHVMAHEISHVLRRHTVRSSVYREAVQDAKRFLDPAVLTMVTRQHEIEADRDGIVMAFLAGYDPRGGIEFMEARGMKKEIPTQLDHPTYDERIHYLEEYWSNDVKYAWMSFQFGLKSLDEANKLEETDPAKAVAELKEAVGHFNRYKATLEPSREISNNLGIAYAKLGVLSLAKGESPLNRWQTSFSVEKDLALKYVSIKSARRTRGSGESATAPKVPWQLKQARQIFEKAVRKYPGYHKARLNLGAVYLAVGELDKARATLAAVKVTEGIDQGDLANLRGVVEAEAGNHDKAEDFFETAVKVPASNKAGLFNTARLYAKAGRKADAKTAYQSYLQSFPNGAWAEAAKKALATL